MWIRIRNAELRTVLSVSLCSWVNSEMNVEKASASGGAAKKERLVRLCESGSVLVVTSGYDAAGCGTPVVMRNLLSRFSADSYSVITRSMRGFKTVRLDTAGLNVRFLAGDVMWLPGRFYGRLERLRLPVMVARAKWLARRLKPKVIVGVFPDKAALAMTLEAAKTTNTPWIAYLHDTIAENFSATPDANWACRLQQRTFDEASSVFVTGQGMRDLYLQDYGFEARALEISYLEPIPTELPSNETRRAAFLGGTIYGVNGRSVGRVAAALREVGCPLILATAQTWQALASHGIDEHISAKEFHAERSEYLEAIRRQGILVVTLDWPDESSFNPKELATAFPTRAVEYLATGRPILVHCPEHYFLARFFEANKCGLVVKERSVEALSEAVRFLLAGGENVDRMRRAALRAAQDVFAIGRLEHVFRDEVNAVAKLKWGEKLR